MFRIIVDVVTVIVFAFAALTAILLLLQKAARLVEASRPTVTEFEKLEGEDAIITLSDGSKFRGSCTVWHSWPSGVRAPTSIEAICANEWTRQMWRIR